MDEEDEVLDVPPTPEKTWHDSQRTAVGHYLGLLGNDVRHFSIGEDANGLTNGRMVVTIRIPVGVEVTKFVSRYAPLGTHRHGFGGFPITVVRVPLKEGRHTQVMLVQCSDRTCNKVSVWPKDMVNEFTQASVDAIRRRLL